MIIHFVALNKRDACQWRGERTNDHVRRLHELQEPASSLSGSSAGAPPGCQRAWHGNLWQQTEYFACRLCDIAPRCSLEGRWPPGETWTKSPEAMFELSLYSQIFRAAMSGTKWHHWSNVETF